MTEMLFRFRVASLAAAGVIVAAAVGSCTPETRSPQPVAASSPTVTYNYAGDQELIEANRRAAAYCREYQGVPQPARMSDNPDGSRTVVFECVRTADSQSLAEAEPELSYRYRTDEELLAASRAAEARCAARGARPSAALTTDADGTKIVSFRCVTG